MHYIFVTVLTHPTVSPTMVRAAPVHSEEPRDEEDENDHRTMNDIELTRPSVANSTSTAVPQTDVQVEQYQQADDMYEHTKVALHRFFFPKSNNDRLNNDESHRSVPTNETELELNGKRSDESFVRNFWKNYDDILILAVFTQVGVVARLASSTWFTIFGNVFHANSPLFVNLPLNCLSCFIMGTLCSGEQLMEIIATRFSPPTTQHEVLDLSETSAGSPFDGNHHVRRRRKKKDKQRFTGWQPPSFFNQELRDVQLLALERRIRMSKCLVLFPLKSEDVDMMEHYFDKGYKKQSHDDKNFHDLELHESNGSVDLPPSALQSSSLDDGDEEEKQEDALAGALSDSSRSNLSEQPQQKQQEERINGHGPTAAGEPHTDAATQEPDYQSAVQDSMTDFANTMQENVETLRRVNLADGWDSGTTPEAMSDDLMLGLRDGFCGALSSFSSWNSAMVHLLRNGQIGEAFVGYMLGLQLPIIAYRFGQHVAVYLFVWRTRRETKIAERRGGYGIQIAGEEVEPDEEEDEVPSVRAVITAIFIMALVTQCTSISFFSAPDDQQIALSLLFSPLGVLARWRLSKFNRWRPNFPLGTFVANLLACALSGSLGSLLAGNPGPRERIFLVSVIAGFGGTLSSLATFVVEILAGIDPILFRFDGMIYAVASIGCALVIGFIFSASVEWADETSSLTADEGG